MLRFNANLFRLAFACASNDATRYYLKGVYVEPHAKRGVTLTAMDGHRLVCIHDEFGFADESAIINLGASIKQCKPRRGETENRFVVIDGANATITEGDTIADSSPIGMAYNVRIDGVFPDYRRVVPQSFGNNYASEFAGRYISAFGDLACELAAHNSKDRGNYTMRIYGERGSPALITFPAFDFAFGILMPVRGEDTTPDVPSWFREPVAITQAA